MYAYYSASHRYLDQDDIDGIRTIYGNPGTYNFYSGPFLVCSSGATFTVNVPPGCTIYWDKSSNITLPTDRTTNPIVATANGNGTGWIQATVSSSCGSVTLPQYPVVVGSPTPAITAVKTSGSGEPTTYDFFASLYPGSTYNWYVNNVFNSSSSYPDNSFEWYFPCRVSKTIKCKITNDCGTSSFLVTALQKPVNAGLCWHFPQILPPIILRLA